MTNEDFKSEVQQLRKQLVGVAKKYVDDADDAEDVVQDVLLKLWQMREQLHSPINSLAFKVTRNHAIDLLRRQRKEKVVETAVTDEEQEPKDERIDRIMAIINILPSMQQTVLRLRHMEGMEMSDIAELMGCTEVVVRKTLSRARLKVKEQYIIHYK